MNSTHRIKQGLSATITWVKQDYHSNSNRFILEAVAWIVSIGCTIAVAVFAPYPPMFWLYPFYIFQCAIFAWSAWTRNSMGMFLNYLLITTIDSIGLIKILFYR